MAPDDEININLSELLNSSVNFKPKYIGGSELPKDLDLKI